MNNRNRQLASVLHELVEREGVEGAELIRPDGQCVMELFRQNLDVSTYSTWSATLAAASEGALSCLKTGKTHHVVAQADRMKVALVEAKPDLIVAALARADQPSDRLVELLEDAAHDVKRIVAG